MGDVGVQEPLLRTGAVRFAILGALEARAGEHRVELGPFKQRVVLGLLLCQANRIVSIEALCDAVWADAPPRTAHKNLQVYVSALRKTLGAGADAPAERRSALLHTSPGYLMRVGPDQLDVLRFHELARAGRLAARNGDGTAAAHLLGEAVRMWRGPVLVDLLSAPTIAAQAARLEDQYLGVYEDWIEAELELGHHAELLEGIDELAGRHPFRERLRYAQMLGLYRSGRRTEALARFDAMRQALARELGLRPSPVLARLYQAILTGDPGLDVRPPHRAKPITVRTDRTRLPRDVADFTGCARPAAALLDVLGAQRPGGLAAVSGPVGVGKTALAVRCAHRLGAGFPDGRVFVRLRGSDGRPRPVSEVLAELLRVVRPAGALPRGQEERSALFREAAAERRILFVLDDAATEEQVRSVLPGAGASLAVVTSRRQLLGLESAEHVVLEPMPEAEAVELLGRLIGDGRVAAETAAARRIAELCCLLPLAVRIVGAKLAGLRHLTLADYAGRLADERRLLDELVAGDVRMRPRIEAAYRDLAPDDQAALRRIGALPDSAFGLSGAAAALGTGPARAEKALERLIESHLVTVHAGRPGGYEARYSLLPLIRTFVREPAAS